MAAMFTTLPSVMTDLLYSISLVCRLPESWCIYKEHVCYSSELSYSYAGVFRSVALTFLNLWWVTTNFFKFQKD